MKQVCMNRLSLFFFGAAFLVLVACSDRSVGKAQPGKPKPVEKMVAAEADNLFSDAAFAMQVRDYARMQQALSKAVELRSDIPEWWELLGYSFKLLGKTGDARSAYKKALSLWEDRYDAVGDAQLGMRRVYVLVLLSRVDEARSLVEKLAKKHPTDSVLQGFVRNKSIDKMLSDPEVQKKKL
jgi:tetratricopeptide (TPR) repeat protein